MGRSDLFNVDAKGRLRVGAASLAELHEKADLDSMTSAGVVESHPRVIMTSEPPNYPGGVR